MSEMTMVEQVARAIYQAEYDDSYDTLLDEDRELARKQARAAIAAMREPSAEAIEAACVAMTNVTPHGASARLGARTAGERFADGWRAAIDEALR